MRHTGLSRRRFLVSSCRMGLGTAMLASLPVVRAEADAASRVASSPATPVALAFDPATQTLFKATATALFRSADGGRRWSPVALPSGSKPAALTAVAMSAGVPGALYVAGHGIGVLRSTDGGQSWTARNDGFPGPDVSAFASHADRPETAYAYLASKGIFRSEDGGMHWKLMDAGPRGGVTHFIHTNMPGSMQSGWLFVAGPLGVKRAMDCFCNWRDAGGLGRPVQAIAYDPRRPSGIYAATEAGLVWSRDGGETWSKFEAPIEAIAAMVVAPSGEIYAIGPDDRLFRGTVDAATWDRIDA